jgi:hypothetical protein
MKVYKIRSLITQLPLPVQHDIYKELRTALGCSDVTLSRKINTTMGDYDFKGAQLPVVVGILNKHMSNFLVFSLTVNDLFSSTENVKAVSPS